MVVHSMEGLCAKTSYEHRLFSRSCEAAIVREHSLTLMTDRPGERHAAVVNRAFARDVVGRASWVHLVEVLRPLNLRMVVVKAPLDNVISDSCDTRRLSRLGDGENPW